MAIRFSYIALLFGALSLASPLAAQDDDAEQVEAPAPTPEQVLAAAPAEHWLPIPVGDLMVFELEPDADGNDRRVIIQLLPAAYSGGHVRNVRKLAALKWWDDAVIYRVAENFVTQFGGSQVGKTVPEALETVPESEYYNAAIGEKMAIDMAALEEARAYSNEYQGTEIKPLMKTIFENYGAKVGFADGWPTGIKDGKAYPLMCRGSLSPAHYAPPDTGPGTELSIITGEEARGLDTEFGNIGRVIEGLEHVRNLPLGDKDLGFYSDESMFVPIKSVYMAATLPPEEQPQFEYLASYSPSLLQYIAAHDEWGNICTVDVPIRRRP